MQKEIEDLQQWREEEEREFQSLIREMKEREEKIKKEHQSQMREQEKCLLMEKQPKPTPIDVQKIREKWVNNIPDT